VPRVPETRRRRRAPIASLLLLLVLALAACGRSGPAGARGPDLSTPEAVYESATRALAAGDLEALRATLSPDGERRVLRDLEAWRRVLVDPGPGPRALSRLPPVSDAADAAARMRALVGDPAELLRLSVRADPRTPEPPPPAARAPDATWAQIDYRARDGSLRRVVMTRRGAEWRVDALQL
jgi:hypothetical protein